MKNECLGECVNVGLGVFGVIGLFGQILLGGGRGGVLDDPR